MEDREEALGRPLTDDERADSLRRHGHPMLVAGRYRSRRHVIGPAFFPIYLFALQMGLGVALIVTIVVGTIDAVVHGHVVARHRHGRALPLTRPRHRRDPRLVDPIRDAGRESFVRRWDKCVAILSS
jgi:hypothetical protein